MQDWFAVMVTNGSVLESEFVADLDLHCGGGRKQICDSLGEGGADLRKKEDVAAVGRSYPP